MRKSVQKNHNKAESKEIHAPHPTNKKKHRFHPLKQDKIGTIIFQFHFTDPSDPITDPLQTLRTHRTHRTYQTYQTYQTYPTQKASVRFTTSRAIP